METSRTERRSTINARLIGGVQTAPAGRDLAPHVVEFRGVKITAEGILFRDDQIMGGSFARAENFRRWTRKRQNKRYDQKLSTRKFRAVESVVWVTDDWSKGYFHWLADVLPKLVIAADRLATSKLLLPSHFRGSALVADSLALFGITNFEFIDPSETIIADTFHLPVHVQESGDFDSGVIREVRRILTEAAGSDEGPHDKRIYISRKYAKRRRVVNEDELINVLRDFAFETVYAEELSFRDQIRLFSSCHSLISAHGAGLANMLFMPERSRIIEFRKIDDRSSDCFVNMAVALGHEFHVQPCPATDEDQAPYSADLAVDIRSLRIDLDRVFAK